MFWKRYIHTYMRAYFHIKLQRFMARLFSWGDLLGQASDRPKTFSAEYSAAFSCRIFVFGRIKKIRFWSITITSRQAQTWRNFLLSVLSSIIFVLVLLRHVPTRYSVTKYQTKYKHPRLKYHQDTLIGGTPFVALYIFTSWVMLVVSFVIDIFVFSDAIPGPEMRVRPKMRVHP
jgi:hypothetical protein